MHLEKNTCFLGIANSQKRNGKEVVVVTLAGKTENLWQWGGRTTACDEISGVNDSQRASCCLDDALEGGRFTKKNEKKQTEQESHNEISSPHEKRGGDGMKRLPP